MKRMQMYSVLLLLLFAGFPSRSSPESVSNAFLNMTTEEFREKLLENKEESQEDIDDLWEWYAVDEEVSFYSPSFESTITGTVMESEMGRTIYAFRGFRYGYAVGETRRFKPPEPQGKYWIGNNFNANEFGRTCPQGFVLLSLPNGEDCLHLNVYTPYHPDDSKKLGGLPVMFFIHGGFFTGGSSNSYLPNKLLDHDVILVTINYRLGALGFFSLNNRDAPGNAALYDMIEALRWVNRYIEDFGGNKNKVTVFGESAGSVAVSYMMIVPPARGLFRAVISESGSSFDPWAFDEESESAAIFIADRVGCPTENKTAIFECVSTVKYGALTNAQTVLVNWDRIHGELGFRGTSPSLQSFTLDPDDDFEFVVTKHPREYIMSGDFAKVSLMTGANKQEGSFIAALIYFEYMLLNGYAFNEDYKRNQMIPDLLSAIRIEDDTHGIAKSLAEIYCPGIDLADMSQAWPCLTDMLSMFFLKAGSWELTKLHSYFVPEKLAYYYAFEVEEDDTMTETSPFNSGVAHGDELKYLFPRGGNRTQQQNMTSRQMTKLWTNFATYLNPTPYTQKEELEEMGIAIWTPYVYGDPHYILMERNNFTVQKEYSERWTITMDEIRGNEKPSEECTGKCQDYKSQRDAYMVVMIVFVIAVFITTVIGILCFMRAKPFIV